jgi:hypothetical protein
MSEAKSSLPGIRPLARKSVKQAPKCAYPRADLCEAGSGAGAAGDAGEH